MRAGRSVVVLLAAVVLLGGCAAIPESSPVVPVGPEDVQTEEPVAPPTEGLDPLLIVRQFIEASAKPANQYAAAKVYLTEEAKRTWRIGPRVVVLDGSFATVYPTGSDDADSDTSRQVLLRGQQLGELGEDGAFFPNRATVTPTMTLVQVDGQWRISEPPDGLLLRLADFRSIYRSVGVTFVDPSRGTLVTDQRWVLNQNPAVVPGRVIDLLLGGPSAAVKDAVVNRLDGAQVRTNVVVGENGALVVDLANVPAMDEQQQRQAVAQILSSLRLVVSQRVRILSDGSALVPNQPEWGIDAGNPLNPDGAVKPDLPVLAVSDGRVIRTPAAPFDGAAGDGSLAVESAAMSIDGEQLAVVAVNGGSPRLHIGPPDALRPVELSATTMTRPTWRSGGPAPETWTVIDGKDGVAVRRLDNGELRPFVVNLAELSVKGRITELRLSRDGVRVAAVVDGALYVAIVAGDGPDTRVLNPRLLVGPGAPQIADVDWFGEEEVVVATLSKENPGVYSVTINGVYWEGYTPTNLTGPLTGITAASGRDVFVADQTGLWSAGDPTDIWYSTINGRRADPFYPG